MISSLVLCLDYSGLYAAGTFSSSIGLLSEETGEDILLYLGDVPGPATQRGHWLAVGATVQPRCCVLGVPSNYSHPGRIRQLL